MPRIAWTRPAQADLRTINDWLTENRDPGYVVRVMSSVRARASFLERFPHAGRPGIHGERILRVLYTPYLILYRLNGDRVEILRVRHEREDWLVEFP